MCIRDSSKVVRGKFRQAAVVLFTAPCLPLGIEIILDLYLQGQITCLLYTSRCV